MVVVIKEQARWLEKTKTSCCPLRFITAALCHLSQLKFSIVVKHTHTHFEMLRYNNETPPQQHTQWHLSGAPGRDPGILKQSLQDC